VPTLLPRISVLSERFASAGWYGKGLLRATPMNAAEAERAGVLVIPVPGFEGQPELIQAAPPFTLSDDELDEAFRRLA
jgi:hypothetical protein